MPKLNRPLAARATPFTPAPFMPSGWGDSDPYAGSQGEDYKPTLYSSYGNPVGPYDDRPRNQAAGMVHMLGADAQQASGRYRDPAVTSDNNAPIYTPTSYIFHPGPWPTQPSVWLSGVQLPDWMEK